MTGKYQTCKVYGAKWNAETVNYCPNCKNKDVKEAGPRKNHKKWPVQNPHGGPKLRVYICPSCKHSAPVLRGGRRGQMGLCEECGKRIY